MVVTGSKNGSSGLSVLVKKVYLPRYSQNIGIDENPGFQIPQISP
jgi:hypothetical protein